MKKSVGKCPHRGQIDANNNLLSFIFRAFWGDFVILYVHPCSYRSVRMVWLKNSMWIQEKSVCWL